MRLTMDEKRTIIRVFATKYNQARKLDKATILNEFIKYSFYKENYLEMKTKQAK